MDWKSQLAPSIEAALERSMYATVQESAEEAARRRKMWLRIKRVEDMVRRDPVYAEKLARRHAAFRDSISAAEKVAMATSSSTAPSTTLITRAPTTCSTSCPSRAVASSVSALTATAASTSSTSTGGIIPERCCYDLELAASTPTSSRFDLHAPAASDTSKRATSIQTTAAPDSIVGATSICEDSRVALVAPATCSTQCPSRDVMVSVSALAPAATSDSSKVTIGVVPECCCSDPEPAAVTSTLISKLDVSGARASAPLEPDLFTTPPTTSSVVFLDPIHVAPAAVLTQATLDIMDSRGSAVLVTMSVQVDTPEGTDTAVTDEDERLLAGSSVERPLALVAVRDVADDHSFVTDTSAMPQTLVALSVNNGRVADKHKVLLPLKLLVPLFKSKELNVSPLLPQCTRAMVAWSTYLNQLHAQYSGMCSNLSCSNAMTHLMSLLPWDPGEKTGVSTDYVLSRDIAGNAYVKQMDASVSGSHDHHYKSGYAKRYSNWSIQMYCSSQNALGKCSCKGIYVEMLQNQFNCAGPFSKQYWEYLTACAITYPAMFAALVPFEDSMLGFFGNVQKNFQPLYLEASTYFSPAADSVPYGCAPGTARMVFPYGSVSIPWELASLLLYQFHCVAPFYQWSITSLVRGAFDTCQMMLIFWRTWDISLFTFSEPLNDHLVEFSGHMEQSYYWNSLMSEGATHYGAEYFPWKIVWFLVGYTCGSSDQEESGTLTGKCRQDCGVETRPQPWPSFEHDQDGWQQGLPPHQAPSTLLVNFDYSLVAWFGCYIGEACVSEFGGLIDGDATSYVHSREMINGFHHARLWDPGGIHSLAWISPWRVILVNCRSVPHWSPTPVNCHFARMHIMLSRRAQMTEEFNSGTSLDLVVYGGYPALTLAYTSSWRLMLAWFLLQYDPAADVNLLLISGQQVTIPCAVQRYTSSSTFLAILQGRGKVRKHYTCMWAIIESVQLLNKQSSSHYAIVGRNRTAWCHQSVTAVMVWPIQLLELFRIVDQGGKFNPTGLGGHCLDHAYYFDKVCANQVCYLDVSRDQVHISHDYYLDIFLEQVCIICYLNLVKVCLDYGNRLDLVEVMNLQVPWDPGGSPRHRLEVKPKFKEGGMLATLLPAGPPLLGWACSDTRRGGDRYIRENHLPKDSALDWMASASSALGLLLPPLFLSSSSSSSVMA